MAKIKKEDRETIKFIDNKKKEMKNSQYRKKFDALVSEIDTNLVNTNVSYGTKLYEKSGWGSTVFYNKMSNGTYDINVFPQKMGNRDQNISGVPVSQECIAFSKILIATSVLAGKLPDAEVIADDKVYARAMYELWKRSWSLVNANGTNTLMLTYQGLFTYGCGAWRVYPRRVQVKRKGIDKILFDDIYREPLDMKRTWFGVGYNHGDRWSQFEVYYEKDMPKDEFFDMFPQANGNKKNLDYVANAEIKEGDNKDISVSDEAKEENFEKGKTHVTIGYYENVLLNRYIVKCGKMVIYDGELPNDDNYGSVVTARCFVKDINDPYGVGLYEMMRGNTALYTYINSLNAQQIEAEIFPLLFGAQVQNGTATYKRGPNVVNPKHPGSDIDVIRTTGNVSGGIAFGDKQKQTIEEITGVNNIVAGQNAESTLGSTVILKEAAYNRLTPPKNSMVDGLQLDAHIANSWIQQTYPVDKIFMIDNDQQLAEFTKQNPDYFMESQEILDDEGKMKGYAVAASKNLRLNFDFTPEGEMMEDVPTRTISSKKLFDEMTAHGHKSDYIEFIIDPDSMLLPSIEIKKQTFMSLFPVITNQITIIQSLRIQNPEGAITQLKALEQLLDIQNQNIYDYIPKQQYDAILAMTPPQNMPPMGPAKTPSETLNYKDAPPDVQREIEKQAGLEPSQMEGVPSQTPGTVPPIKKGQPGTSDNTDVTKPLANNQVARPQSPMGASFDGSLGRAANSNNGFFPQ